MGKRILFSPIGGNDPVSSSTGYDGSMLHICRQYKPDKVVLFLSKEMTKRQERDDRYRYCIERLGEKLNHHFEIIEYMREDLEEVQVYDEFYKIFKPIIYDIQNTMKSEDELFFNVASGTPAMKSALLMLAIMYEGKIRVIQVTTPEKAINVHYGKKDVEYNPKEYWELNQDNNPEEKNRCVEVGCPNLIAMLKKNIIVRQVESYNYAAAIMLADEIRKYISEETYSLLEIAVARQQLDLNKVTSLSNMCGYEILPVKNENEKILFEYALTLQIKIVRKEYGDFMRAISPLITDLFEEILKVQCGIKVHDYCESKHGVWSWKISKLRKNEKGQEILQVLNEGFGGQFRDSIVAASNLKPILMYYLTDDTIKKSVEDMRKIEEKVRNLAAHEITSVTDDKIQEILGMPITMNQIFKYIKKLVVAAKVHVKENDWNSYDQMNELIKKAIYEE